MNNLSKYMLSNNNINNILNNIPNINTQNIKKKDITQNDYINIKNFFSPNFGEDPLFWCIYISINDINGFIIHYFDGIIIYKIIVFKHTHYSLFMNFRCKQLSQRRCNSFEK